MRSKTTSIHNINADRPLNKLQVVFYLLLNWVNNLFAYTNIDNNLVILDFGCEGLKKHWSRLEIKSSPARRLSALFLLNLPWSKIRKELGEINILDIGCDSGNNGLRLNDYSNNGIRSYTGIDIRKSEYWTKLKNQYSNFRFHQIKSNNISNYIPERTDFIFTHSAVEHFDNDLSYFKQIKDYIRSYHKSVIQVHLLPSSSCLRLYLFHGVRQYTPRTISKITRMFKDFSYAVLFRLGGKDCIRLHYEFITKPAIRRSIGDLRDLKTQEYERSLLMAIEHDMKRPHKIPIFYALVIHSNWRKKIF